MNRDMYCLFDNEDNVDNDDNNDDNDDIDDNDDNDGNEDNNDIDDDDGNEDNDDNQYGVPPVGNCFVLWMNIAECLGKPGRGRTCSKLRLKFFNIYKKSSENCWSKFRLKFFHKKLQQFLRKLLVKIEAQFFLQKNYKNSNKRG